jgi:hypothetical protein
MGTLNDVIGSLDELKSFVASVDATVEALYDQIKLFTNSGITSEVADQLLAKVAEVRSAVDKVQSDDEPAVA